MEIYLNRGSNKEARFYLDEAAFIVEQNLLLDRKDLLLFYYFCHELKAPWQEEDLGHATTTRTGPECSPRMIAREHTGNSFTSA